MSDHLYRLQVNEIRHKTTKTEKSRKATATKGAYVTSS